MLAKSSNTVVKVVLLHLIVGSDVERGHESIHIFVQLPLALLRIQYFLHSFFIVVNILFPLHVQLDVGVAGKIEQAHLPIVRL